MILQSVKTALEKDICPAFVACFPQGCWLFNITKITKKSQQ